MAEFTANAAQTVTAGQNVLFTETPICYNRNSVTHREGSGLITLRGTSGCQARARYKVTFGGNVSIPTGGTAGTISVALTLNGEAIPASSASVTPAAVEEPFNVFVAAYVDVPQGCCVTITVENTASQSITVANANIIIERTA